MGTKVKQTQLMRELYRDRTPIIEACQKVQLTVKGKIKDGKENYITTVVDQQCSRISDDYCSACAFPDAKWRIGKCNLATHLHREAKRGEPTTFLTPINEKVGNLEEIQQKLNPIKASKRRR